MAQSKAQIKAKLQAALAALDEETAETQVPTVAATAPLPGWVQDAQSVSKAKGNGQSKAKPKPQPITPHWTAHRATFNDVPGYRITKMFGDSPNSRRPDGKFVTRNEALALFGLMSREGQS